MKRYYLPALQPDQGAHNNYYDTYTRPSHLSKNQATQKDIDKRYKQHKAWKLNQGLGCELELECEDLKDISLYSFDCRGINFGWSDLRGMVLSKLKNQMTECNFTACKLDNAEMMYMNLSGCSFQSASLVDVDFTGSIFECVRFDYANLTGSTFKGCKFICCSFNYANIKGVYFDPKAKVKEVSWVGTNREVKQHELF